MALFRDATGRPGPAGWKVGAYPQGEDDLPVTGVSWYEAAAFAAFVGKRLPSIYHWTLAGAPTSAATSRPAPTSAAPWPRSGATAAASTTGGSTTSPATPGSGAAPSGGQRFALGGGCDGSPYMFWEYATRPPSSATRRPGSGASSRWRRSRTRRSSTPRSRRENAPPMGEGEAPRRRGLAELEDPPRLCQGAARRAGRVGRRHPAVVADGEGLLRGGLWRRARGCVPVPPGACRPPGRPWSFGRAVPPRTSAAAATAGTPSTPATGATWSGTAAPWCTPSSRAPTSGAVAVSTSLLEPGYGRQPFSRRRKTSSARSTTWRRARTFVRTESGCWPSARGRQRGPSWPAPSSSGFRAAVFIGGGFYGIPALD